MPGDDIRPGQCGVEGALARGETAKLEWIRSGVVVPPDVLSEAWGLSPQALEVRVRRGELFSVKVKNQLYYPGAFTMFDRQTVANITRSLGSLSASEKLIFWLRVHGGLGGQTVPQALVDPTQSILASLERVCALAGEWAREAGADSAAS